MSAHFDDRVTEETPLLTVADVNNRSRASSTETTRTVIWSPTAPPAPDSSAGGHASEPHHAQNEDDSLTKAEKDPETASVRTAFKCDDPHIADLEANHQESTTDGTSEAPARPISNASNLTARPPRTATSTPQPSLFCRFASCVGANPRILRGTLIASGLTAALLASASAGTLYYQYLSDLNGPKSLCKDGEWQTRDRWNCGTGVDTQRVPITSHRVKIDGHVIDFKPLGGASAGRLAYEPWDSGDGRPSTVLFVNVEPEGHTDGDESEKGVCFISVNSENGVDQKDRINVQKCLFVPDQSSSGSSKPDEAETASLHGWIPFYPVEKPYPTSDDTHLVCSPWTLLLHPRNVDDALNYARELCETQTVREGNTDDEARRSLGRRG